jgi:hypothetical protein
VNGDGARALNILGEALVVRSGVPHDDWNIGTNGQDVMVDIINHGKPLFRWYGGLEEVCKDPASASENIRTEFFARAKPAETKH